MKTKVLILVMALLLISSTVFAERVFRQGPKTSFSDNKTYCVQIFEQSAVSGTCEAVFKKDYHTVWEKTLSSIPGIVNITEDGQSIIFVNPGGVSFYDGEGNLISELKFGPGENSLRQIKKSALSADGQYLVLADSQGVLLFYSVKAPKLLWEKEFYNGKDSLDDLQISGQGDFMLLSVYNINNAEILFKYIDKDGMVIWEKNISRGYPIRREGLFGTDVYINEDSQKFIDLAPDGKSFSIYSHPEHKWIKFENRDGKVAEESVS